MPDDQHTREILTQLAQIQVAIARVEERLTRHDEDRSITADRVASLERSIEKLTSRVDKAEGALAVAKWAGGAGGLAGLSGLVAALATGG